jgi:uncharacterized protein (DUF1330 family)
MSAFVIAEIAISDPDGYEKYKPLAGASVEAHGGTYRVRGGAVETLEGPAVEERIVVLEFPDAEAARDWYHSDEYGAARPLRQAASSGRMFLVEGLPSQ